MTVKCKNMPDLLYVISESVKQGLQFEADTDTLTITYSGGY